MKNLFTCTVVYQPDCTVAYLEGELDMSTAESLRVRLAPLVGLGCNVVVNLADLRFLGTAGLRALAEIARDATAAGGSVCLAEVPDLVSRVLTITGMRDSFT